MVLAIFSFEPKCIIINYNKPKKVGNIMQMTSKMERLTLYLTKEEKLALLRAAQRDGRSMAMQARELILKELQEEPV